MIINIQCTIPDTDCNELGIPIQFLFCSTVQFYLIKIHIISDPIREDTIINIDISDEAVPLVPGVRSVVRHEDQLVTGTPKT